MDGRLVGVQERSEGGGPVVGLISIGDTEDEARGLAAYQHMITIKGPEKTRKHVWTYAWKIALAGDVGTSVKVRPGDGRGIVGGAGNGQELDLPGMGAHGRGRRGAEGRALLGGAAGAEPGTDTAGAGVARGRCSDGRPLDVGGGSVGGRMREGRGEGVIESDLTCADDVECSEGNVGTGAGGGGKVDDKGRTERKGRPAGSPARSSAWGSAGGVRWHGPDGAVDAAGHGAGSVGEAGESVWGGRWMAGRRGGAEARGGAGSGDGRWWRRGRRGEGRSCYDAAAWEAGTGGDEGRACGTE